MWQSAPGLMSLIPVCYVRYCGLFHLSAMRKPRRLKDWATNLAETQSLASSFVQSKAFEDIFVRRYKPRRLSVLAAEHDSRMPAQGRDGVPVDGWTSLDAAIRFISKENRDQVPSRYGCKTWRQVLKKSGLFELRCPAPEEGAIGRAWYRSCPDVPASGQGGPIATPTKQTVTSLKVVK